MTRVDVILETIRRELERRPGLLEGGGLRSLLVQCHFDGDGYAPRDVAIRPEFVGRRPGKH